MSAPAIIHCHRCNQEGPKARHRRICRPCYLKELRGYTNAWHARQKTVKAPTGWDESAANKFLQTRF